MYRFISLSLSLILLLSSFLAVAPLSTPATGAQAASPPAELPGRLGVMTESAPTFATFDGQAFANVAAFRSSRAASLYFIFPPPLSEQEVQSVNLLVLSRTGTYTSTATLTLEALDSAGVIQRTLSSAGLELQTVPTHTWQALALNTANTYLLPTEMLAVRVDFGAGVGGDLDVRPIFEVTFNPLVYEIFLPIIRR